MLSYSLRRLAVAVPTLLVVLTIVFLLVRVAPGDPAVAALGDFASESAVQEARERMGLDRPLIEQYVSFLGGLVRGDLGRSMITGQSISAQVAGALPHTLELTIAAMLVGIALGVPLGVVTGVRRNRWADYVGRVLSLLGLSFPAFVLGILLIFVFAVRLRLFPTLGAGAFSDPLDNLYHLVLPALTLGLIATAYITRTTRSVIIDTLSEDFVRTARAKGMIERLVLSRHALRPGMIPIASLVGVFFVSLIGSSVMTEVVFSRPGLGKLMVGAISKRDYTSLQSIMVVYTIFVIGLNILTDLLYGVLDPRIRYR